jgi:arylsulfatase A-like enzyme
MAYRLLLLVVAVLGCGREADTPRSRDQLAPWRHLVDELASDDPDPHPSATVGEVTRYVMAELPAQQLSARVASRDGTETEILVDCPPELAGRPIAVRAVHRLAIPNRALANGVIASPKTRCPAETGTPASVRLKDVRAPEMDGTAIALIGTAGPAPRVETRWLTIPAAAVLEVTFGMANPGRAPALPGARFQIRAEGRDGASLTLLARDVDAGAAAGQRWQTERIPLGREIASLGPETRLVFETSVAEADRPAFPVWGDPVILVPAPPPSPARRNVVLISLDTMRADRLGCYGALGGNTPALDRIAHEGALFQNAIAAAPWTLPSHTTLLTGFHGCVRLGLAENDRSPAGIAPLPELLRNAGYTTAAFTEGGYMSPTSFQRGFGLYSALGDTAAERPWGNVDRTVGDATDWLTHEAREPFFLFVHTYQVHSPYNAPPPYGDLQRPADGGELASRTLEARSRTEMARYDEEVRYTDAVMARLFDTLAALDLWQRTILVIVADHGDAFGEHGHFQHVLYLDEEVMRVPFIWVAPGLVAAGRRIPTVAGLIDFTPTVLELLGLEAPQFIEGVSLAQLLRDVDPPFARAAHRFVFAERMLKGTPYPVLARGATWRAVFGQSGPLDMRTIGPDGVESSAPVGPAALALATKARELYEDHCRRLPNLLPRERQRARPVLPDPEQEERLRALGYVE